MATKVATADRVVQAEKATQVKRRACTRAHTHTHTHPIHHKDAQPHGLHLVSRLNQSIIFRPCRSDSDIHHRCWPPRSRWPSRRRRRRTGLRTRTRTRRLWQRYVGVNHFRSASNFSRKTQVLRKTFTFAVCFGIPWLSVLRTPSRLHYVQSMQVSVWSRLAKFGIFFFGMFLLLALCCSGSNQRPRSILNHI